MSNFSLLWGYQSIEKIPGSENIWWESKIVKFALRWDMGLGDQLRMTLCQPELDFYQGKYVVYLIESRGFVLKLLRRTNY